MKGRSSSACLCTAFDMVTPQVSKADDQFNAPPPDVPPLRLIWAGTRKNTAALPAVTAKDALATPFMFSPDQQKTFTVLPESLITHAMLGGSPLDIWPRMSA